MASFDCAAEALLDLVADELRVEHRDSRKKPRFNGLYPKSPAGRRFVRGFGIIKHLELLEHALPDEEADRVKTFHRRRRHYSSVAKPEQADPKSVAIARFVDYVNECLSGQSRQLTPKARQMLGAYVSEIVDNAEEHPGMSDWTITGYLDTSDAMQVCTLSIFNFGNTIADTLKALEPQSYTAVQIAPYLEIHRRRSLFSPAWREQDLLTLVALQGHVSSKNESDANHRGQGTVNFIEFFQRVHAECSRHGSGARMAIVSGGTHILFDGAYKLSEDEQGRKRIAFNTNNSLYEKPDSNYVRSLGSVTFPGTIISIQFAISDDAVTTTEPAARGESHEPSSN
jgi:hypothetical protein